MKKNDNNKKKNQTKAELAGEVYDLMLKKYTPEQRKRLPSKAEFIKTNLKPDKFTGRTTSKSDLKKRKEELLIETGGKKSAPATAQKKTTPPVDKKGTSTPAKKPTTDKKQTKLASAQKPAPVQKKTTLPAEKKAATDKQPKLKAIKHSDADENRTDSDRPIIINNKKPEPKKPIRRELKRVKTGGYTVFDGARAGKTFETSEEARNYAAHVLLTTGELVNIAHTERNITHTFRPEQETKKKKK